MKNVSLFNSAIHILRLVKHNPIRIYKGAVIFLTLGPKGFVKKLNEKKFVVEVNPSNPTIADQVTHLFKVLINDPIKVKKGFGLLVRVGPQNFYRLLKAKRRAYLKSLSLNQQYKSWFRRNYPTTSGLNGEREESRKFEYVPKISIIVPTYNSDENLLRECFESVLNQSYENWELCIADDASTNNVVREVIKEFAGRDKRVKFIFRDENGHISKASNSALELATGSYVGFLDHDDTLWPNALFEVVVKLNENREAEFLYSDEEKLTFNGQTHEDPYFKPNWSPDYLRSLNYITHFAVLKKSLIDKIGGLREDFEGAQDWDLFLRATRELGEKNPISEVFKGKIIHIPKVLYSWRKTVESTASGKSNVKNYAYDNQRKALEDDLRARKIEGEVVPTTLSGVWRVKYKIIEEPLVSIVIPTKDKFDYIKRCLESIKRKSTYQNYEIVLVDTGSTDRKVLKLYKDFKTTNANFRLFNWNEKFNFSAVCNFGVKEANGKYVLLLNNDTEVITPDWIESMLEHAQREDVGAVGCKLLFPDNRIQHAGVILGIKGGNIRKGVAGHAFKRQKRDDRVVNFQVVDAVRNWSAVTAACVMISKEKYEEVMGQDPTFRIAYNDVDFCLRLSRKGYFNVFTPYTVLYHHESVSVGTPERGDRDLLEFRREINLMHQKWGKLLMSDPFYNPNLSLTTEDFNLK